MDPFNTLLETVVHHGHESGSIDLDLSTVVPAGQQLVVEFVSSRTVLPTGQKPDLTIVILNGVGSAVVQHYLVPRFLHTSASQDIYVSADPARMHLSSDLTLRVVLQRDATNGTASCFFGISGYLTTP